MAKRRVSELKSTMPTQLTCTVCKKAKARSNFYTSSKEIWGEGVCLMCKSCLADMLIDERTKQLSMDNWHKVLNFLDIPHIPSIFAKVMAKDGVSIGNVIGEYKKMLNLNHEYSKLRYLDSVHFELDTEEIKKNSAVKVSRETMEFWGLGYEPKDYIRFENRYKRLIENEKADTIDYIKEMYYKALPKLELQAEKQLMAGDTKAHKDTMTTIKDICTVCNINPIQTREDNANTGSYDLFIKRIENEDPVFDFERDLGNKDEVKEFLELYLYSYLYDVNGMSTPFSGKLEEELDMFTPTLDEEDYEDDDYDYEDEDE